MARLAGSGFVRNGESVTWDTDLDYHLYDHHTAYGAICSVFDELDVHDELHYAVCAMYYERRGPC